MQKLRIQGSKILNFNLYRNLRLVCKVSLFYNLNINLIDNIDLTTGKTPFSITQQPSQQ